MKRPSFILTISFLCAVILSCKSNNKEIWVLDNEHDLTPPQTIKLDSLYKSHEKKTTNEIALVTTRDYGQDSSIMPFAVNFLRRNGIGKKDKNNGIAIVFSNVNHQIFISTGYGTERVLRDEIVKKIIDSLMLPKFKEAKLFDGIWEGSKAIVDFLEKPENKIN